MCVLKKEISELDPYIIKTVFIKFYSSVHERQGTANFWLVKASSVSRFGYNFQLKIFLVISFKYVMAESHSEAEYETILITTSK